MAEPRLRDLLRDRGRSPADLRAALGVSRSAVTAWLSGERPPRGNRLLPLARFLGVSIDDVRAALLETARRRRAGEAKGHGARAPARILEADRASLRELVENAGWRPAALAEELGVSPATMSAWLGGRSSPRGHRLRDLAERLGVSVPVVRSAIAGSATPTRACRMSLRELLEERGVRPRHLAQSVRVSRASVANWTIGSHRPRGAALSALADALGVSMDLVRSALAETARRRESGEPQS